MCGIAGFIDSAGGLGRSELAAIAGRMADTLAHRGPDDVGVWVDPIPGVAFGHRRLAIIDLSPTGHQPMTSACGRYVLVFNGEIYNFRELREKLESLGHCFHGTSDTEVVLASIGEWGLERAIPKFNGMFALALWDRSERRLSLARDRAGEKPLYYCRCGSAFLFASELKALRAYPGFSPEMDRAALALFIRSAYVPSPYSIYKDVQKLPAATFASVTPGRDDDWGSPVSYWSAREVCERGMAEPFCGDPESAVDELDRLLRDAIRLRMIADVPLGAFLSGGVDSSLVVAIMQALSTLPVRTFTIGFREAKYNEADKARLVARHLGTEHVELYVGPRQLLDVIPRLPSLYDEPFADSSQIPTYLVSTLARHQVTVALTGDAGDELFAGYNSYRIGRVLWSTARKLPLAWRTRLANALTATPVGALDLAFGWMRPWHARFGRNGSTGDKLRKLAPALLAEHPEQMYCALAAHWRHPGAMVIGGEPVASPIAHPECWANLPDVTHRMMYLDFLAYLPDDILVKVDRASMGVGLETRIPLLDHRVVEFAWRLPLSFKVRNGESKWILRKLLYRYVPRPLVDRPKSGFSVPIGQWLRGPIRDWAESLLDETSLRNEGYLNPQTVRQIWKEHLSGARNWEHPLWNVLMFEAWLRSSGVARNVARSREHAPVEL